VNRANRRQDTTALAGAVGPLDDGVEEQVEQKLLGKRRKVWRKYADEPLGHMLARRDGETDLPAAPSDRSPYR
jgi:hypothetical protein